MAVFSRSSKSWEAPDGTALQIRIDNPGGRSQGDGHINATEGKRDEASVVGLLTCYWIPVTFPHLPGGYRRQTLIVGRPRWLDICCSQCGADTAGQG